MKYLHLLALPLIWFISLFEHDEVDKYDEAYKAEDWG